MRAFLPTPALGFRIMHYRWEVGDPDPARNRRQDGARNARRRASGDILINHINGRGWHTAEALPRMIAGLEAEGYRFVLLKDYITARRERDAPHPGLAQP